IRSVSPIRDGGVWVATETAGAYRFSNGRWVRSPSLHEGHLPIFSAMDVAPDGRVWATAAGGGLYYLQEPRWHLHKPFSRLARGVLLAQTNALWVPDYESLLRFSGPEFSQIDRLPNCAGVCCLAEDGSGGLWYSGYGVGLGHWRPQGTTLLHAINGLPSENLISLFKASDGNLWIGTDGSGLLRLHNGHFSVITKRQGLPSDTICQLIEDNAGRLWMGTYAGICAVTLQDLNRCADQSLPKIKCLVLDEADGLESKECSAGNQPAVCRTADGRLWFATKSGVVVVTPSLISINTNSLPVWIEQVNTDTEAVTLARSEEQLTLPLGERRFRITFDVPCLRAAHRVRFMHKLEPLDSQWVEAGTSREVTYTHVPPGHYSFKVIASNEDGVWNSRPASLVLFIQPFLWERPAFQASLGLLLLVASLGGVWQLGRLRTRRRILQFQQQQLVERERARIARDMHDDLGSRLTKAALLTESVVQEPRLPEESRQRAVLLRDTITEMTNSMDELVWAVNPRHDTFDGLANYLLRYAQEYLANTSIECQLDLPLTFPSVTIHSSLRHNLFLAFKEALRNAVRHAQARRVHIGLRLDAGIMCLDVADDGGGFAPEMVHSRGLQNMRDRLALLGGACRVESAPDKGTRIRFEVPLSSRLLTCGTAD
ncbi:MAG: two-component regulator propeller domain-containing protein, partial [Verrucomicrobiota bacterium]